MSRDYFYEDEKFPKLKREAWDDEDCTSIHRTLLEKGYYMNNVIRIGSDGQWHDAWQVQREDIPLLIEMCFRQRLVVEVQAEGSYKAAIIFVYNNRASQIIEAAQGFFKNPNNKGEIL